MIHSLGEIPTNTKRDYFLYLLDYGWKEPLSNALRENFEIIADKASRSNSVVFRGTVGHHFSDEVLSWHNINGIDGENILPAILITTKNPNEFKFKESSSKHKLLLIPIGELCQTANDVIKIIEKIFLDIETKKSLDDFTVAKEMKANNSKSIVDALILQPNITGIGVDLKKIITFFKSDKI